MFCLQISDHTGILGVARGPITTPREFVSIGSRLTVKFHSDVGIAKEGFFVVFQQSKPIFIHKSPQRCLTIINYF